MFVTEFVLFMDNMLEKACGMKAETSLFEVEIASLLSVWVFKERYAYIEEKKDFLRPLMVRLEPHGESYVHSLILICCKLHNVQLS